MGAWNDDAKDFFDLQSVPPGAFNYRLKTWLETETLSAGEGHSLQYLLELKYQKGDASANWKALEEEAGFILGGGPIVPPPTYTDYYKFDGNDDAIKIPTVNMVSGDTCTLEFTSIGPATTTSGMHILSSSESGIGSLAVSASGKLELGATASATLDGQPISSGVTAFPVDGGDHTIVLTSNDFVKIDVIGASNRDGAKSCNFAMWDVDFELSQEGNRLYGIHDGFGGNPRIIDSHSGRHGRAHNFNQENWFTIQNP